MGTLTQANAPFGPLLEGLDELRLPTELEIIQNYQYRKTIIDGKRLTKDMKNRIFNAVSSTIISIWERAGIPVTGKHAVNTKLGRKIAAVESTVGKWNAEQHQNKTLVSQMQDSLNIVFDIASCKCYKHLPVKVS